MECNKDEAVRAKEIGERKFTKGDFAGAKKFVLKAQNLYPGLEGLSWMLTTLDVYISAENKICGEADWYGILGVNPLADDETIRKQYRKLALTLHPDKNKSLGTDGAFKLVSEAWILLSDKAKRLAYNQKRNSEGFQHRVPSKSGPSAPPSANGFFNVANSVSSNARGENSKSRAPASGHSPSYQKANTFWTVCSGCKTHYEYLRIYLNQTLLCPNCHEGFMALEKAPPPNIFKSSNSSRQQHQNSTHHGANSNASDPGRYSAFAQTSGYGRSSLNSFDKTNYQWDSFSRAASVGRTTASPSSASQAASVVRRANEKVKREREQAQAATEWMRSHISKAEIPSKRGRIDDHHINSYGGNIMDHKPMENGFASFGSVNGFGMGNFETQRVNGVSITNRIPRSKRELSFIEIRNMQMEKARNEIGKKLKEWNSVTEAKKEDKKKEKVKAKENKRAEKRDAPGLSEHGKSATSTTIHRNRKSIPGTSNGDAVTEASSQTSINVPDPDFHNFDLDRTERSFGDDQVWAVYDDDDGMPRYYARIHKVISLKPFRMRIGWLNSRSNSELGPLDWIGSGFSKTCGNFKVGKHETSNKLNSFSHKVRWTKGSWGAIRIFPNKGDVWALYRNWSSDWNEHTPDEVVHKYDMVEVVEDYNEETGASVTPLLKVTGFRTLFRRHSDPMEVRRISKDEMFRFSHQVPNYLLTGDEAQNAPKGCRELDPAATPLELLQVITEASEAPVVDSDGKTEDALKNKVDGVVENTSTEKVTKEAEVVIDAKKAKKLECEDS